MHAQSQVFAVDTQFDQHEWIDCRIGKYEQALVLLLVVLNQLLSYTIHIIVLNQFFYLRQIDKHYRA